MTTKHTPGLLETTAWLENDLTRWGVCRPGGGDIIAELAPDLIHDDYDAEVTAHLFASAPDLLHECEREVAWLQHIRHHIEAPESIRLGFDQAIKYLGAAIAKAKGETP